MDKIRYVIRAKECGNGDGWFAEAEELSLRGPLPEPKPLGLYIYMATRCHKLAAQEDFEQLQAGVEAMLVAMGYDPVRVYEDADDEPKRGRVNVSNKSVRRKTHTIR